MDSARAVTTELEVSDYLASRRDFQFRHIVSRATTDGSITGNHPMELILGPIPAMGFDAAMTEITAWVTEMRAQVNETCGMHVHVDARDFGAYELRRLIQIYHILEPLFYELVQPSRATKRHSRVMTDAEWRDLLRCGDETRGGRIREAILLANYARGEGGELRGALGERGLRIPTPHRREPRVGPQASDAIRAAKFAASQKYDSSRYRGLNLHSWFHRGTIEFRQHEGCVQPARIAGWMQWCKWVVEMASRLRDSDIPMIRTPEDFLGGVWKREGALLQLPESVIEFVRGGRDSSPYGHPKWAHAAAASGLFEQETATEVDAFVRSRANIRATFAAMQAAGNTTVAGGAMANAVNQTVVTNAQQNVQYVYTPANQTYTETAPTPPPAGGWAAPYPDNF